MTWWHRIGWLALYGALSAVIYLLGEWRAAIEKKLQPPKEKP